MTIALRHSSDTVSIYLAQLGAVAIVERTSSNVNLVLQTHLCETDGLKSISPGRKKLLYNI